MYLCFVNSRKHKKLRENCFNLKMVLGRSLRRDGKNVLIYVLRNFYAGKF